MIKLSLKNTTRDHSVVYPFFVDNGEEKKKHSRYSTCSHYIVGGGCDYETIRETADDREIGGWGS